MAQVRGIPITRKFIGYGEEAIMNTLSVMRDLITKGAKSYYVRRWAEKLVEGIRSNEEKIRTIFQYLGSHTNYLWDIQNIEFIKSPEVSLQLLELGERPQLDCDCYTVLILSLLKSIGFPVAMRATAYDTDTFAHVYGLVQFNDQWISLDLTRWQNGPGWEKENYTKFIDYPVKDGNW